MSIQYPDLYNTSFPDAVDNFPQFLNMTQADLEYVRQYQDAMERGDTAAAQIAFNNISSGSQKIISPLRLNQIREAILALERFYGTDVESYIEGKQVEWDNRINEFNYMGVFNPSASYSKNNMVTYTDAGKTNMYLNTHTGTTPIGTYPTDTYYWRKLTIYGIKGDPAPTGTVFQFEWDASVSYNVGAIVVYNNAWWIAVEASESQPPVEGSTYWQKVLSISQATFVVQKEQPIGQVPGDLWFEVLD